jgi:hypothetical protein
MKHAVEMALSGVIYIPSFMKIGTGVQAILRLDLRNLRGYRVDITNGRDLRRCFTKIGSIIQKLMGVGGIHIETHTAR